MIDDDDERLKRADVPRDEAPEPDENEIGKRWSYAALGLLVIVLMLLIATGKVQIFPGG